jgi:hypothetical protein
MDYIAAINKLAIAMINANRTIFNGPQIREMCRMVSPAITENQVTQMMTHIKTDSRFRIQKVGARKIYYSYRGEL